MARGRKKITKIVKKHPVKERKEEIKEAYEDSTSVKRFGQEQTTKFGETQNQKFGVKE
jgi:hypothetical protein